MGFFYLYILGFVLIATLLGMMGLDFVTALSGAATSISNVGPGLGVVIGADGNFSYSAGFSKMGHVIWHAAWQVRDIYRTGDAEPRVFGNVKSLATKRGFTAT